MSFLPGLPGCLRPRQSARDRPFHAFTASTLVRPDAAQDGAVASARVKPLVLGTGGREHALVRALAHDSLVTEVHAAPGNPGMAGLGTLYDVDPLDGAAVAALAVSLDVDLVVV